MLGVDVSTWQDGINWAALKQAGVEYAILKVGGSNSGRYTDSKYRRHEAAARAAGLMIGHYWFNGTGNPASDANYFVDNLAHYRPGDLLVLDIENEGSMPAWNPNQAADFVSTVKNRLDVVCALYMSSSVTRSADWGGLAAIGCPLWVASYGANTGSPGTAPRNLGAWGDDWTIWQYTSNGVLPGYSGRLDLNTARRNPFTPKPVPIPEEEDMKQQFVVASTNGVDPWYVTDGIYKRQLIDGEAAILVQASIAEWAKDGQGKEKRERVHIVGKEIISRLKDAK